MSLTPLRFEAWDMLNSTLVAPDGVAEFTVTTPQTYYMQRHTIVTSLTGARAVIKWHPKTFVIGGVERPWKELKKVVGGPLSSKWRIWKWSEPSYTVKYARDADGQMRYAIRQTREDGKWQSDTEAAGTDLARLTPVIDHFMRPPDNALMYLSPKLEDKDRLFLVMIMLASETRRRQSD
ncbi:hypothetical protein FB45DRAFT_1024677 [Roridomyces roridus]|uniref:Uncharacterized protein n=1 Tax=Roridomyces roridus TaxID=1738132 RepID=A0AAD7C1G4_9AGAR|nr:hypothetical protein FB45DRAFT_1024677 [Roridomyces roridus]